MEKYFMNLQKYLIENNICCDCDWIDNEFYATIIWGDWKHEHWRCDSLVEEFVTKNNLVLRDKFASITDENGSDCYSAVHVYRF